MDEFLKLLNSYSGGGSALVYGEWGDFLDDSDDEDDDEDEPTIGAPGGKLSMYKVECVDQEGGEGQGDTIYAVYSVKLNGEMLGYFRANGWYASYHGADYQESEEVEPVERTVTFYETKKTKNGGDNE